MDPTPLHPNRRDRTQVETLSGMGASKEFIADHLSISVEQLDEYYAKPLKMGEEEANLMVAKTFHEMATSGEFPAMTLAWLKMRAGWKDAQNNAPQTSTEDTEAELEEAQEKLLKLINRAANSAQT